MGRDDRIEQRLLEWAQWVTVKRGDGYPVMNVLHASWMPPAPGTTPTLKVAGGSERRNRETHEAIAGALSVRLANTVVAHYCLRLPAAAAAQRLECSVSTVHARIAEAHRRIAAWLRA